MKKIGLLVSTMLLSTQVFAAATLRIPVMIINDENEKIVPAAVFNAKLAAAGLKPLPEYITVSTGEKGYKKIEVLSAQVDKAVTALGGDPNGIRLEGGFTPGDVDTKEYYTCYTGNPLEVPSIVETLTDALYSDQLSMHAMKYKNVTKALYYQIDLEDADTKAFFSESEKWKNWKGQNEDILILSSTSDGGDDLQESLIQRCK